MTRTLGVSAVTWKAEGKGAARSCVRVLDDLVESLRVTLCLCRIVARLLRIPNFYVSCSSLLNCLFSDALLNVLFCVHSLFKIMYSWVDWPGSVSRSRETLGACLRWFFVLRHRAPAVVAQSTAG